MSQDSQQAATIHVTDQPACAHAKHEVVKPGIGLDAKVCADDMNCYLAKEGVLAEGDEALLLCGRPQHSAIIRTSCGFYASFIRLTLCPGLQVTGTGLSGTDKHLDLIQQSHAEHASASLISIKQSIISCIQDSSGESANNWEDIH